MTPERAAFIARTVANGVHLPFWDRFRGYIRAETSFERAAKVIEQAILQACAEDRVEIMHLKNELDELRRNEYICARCMLRKDSEHKATHEF